MASRHSVESEGWPKWQIALAVGAPIAVAGVVGYYCYTRSKSGKKGSSKKGSGSLNEPKKELTPSEKAIAAKNKGNKYFKGADYLNAIKCYTEAIEICPEIKKDEIATFYQNRAAAHEKLKNYDDVISDCTKALEYNKRYAKALMRRARASEVKDDLQQSLEDITAVCILEGFQKMETLQMADKVLKEYGRQVAKNEFQNRKPVPPSPHFVKTYFSTFAHDPILLAAKRYSEKDEDSEPEKDRDETPEKELKDKNSSPYKNAIKCFANKEFVDIIPLCSEEIQDENSHNLPSALLLRATFYLLQGQHTEANADFDRIISDLDTSPAKVKANALIKRGSVKMQNEDRDGALADYELAIKIDPDNSDVYHHLGQLLLVTDKVEEAVKNFQKAVDLNPTFPIPVVQKCYTEYRYAYQRQSTVQYHAVMKEFEAALEKFPDCCEGFALYGQALVDQQDYQKADECFQKALKLEPDNSSVYVHRGLLHMQWKQDVDGSIDIIKKALEVDSKSEFALETLGTIEVQRSNLEKAVEYFNEAISLAKTETEVAHLFSLREAAKVQSRVIKDLGIDQQALFS